MTIIANSLQAIQANIADTLRAAGRINHTLLLAVSKSQAADKLRDAYAAGQKAFGENYVQEAINKQAALLDLAIDWHFIGPIQSNKTALIAQHFSWVHSVDRLKIASRLNDARPSHLPPLNVCIQVNSSLETSKSGINLAETSELAAAFAHLPNLKLRGLMAIPEAIDGFDNQRAQFKVVGDAYQSLVKQGFAIDTLSIGMSGDYVAAIYEGATIVRIGSAIFGVRS